MLQNIVYGFFPPSFSTQMILEMCKDELPTDLKTVRARLHTVESFSMSKVRMNSENAAVDVQLELLRDDVLSSAAICKTPALTFWYKG